jgi:hypothetical protein
MRLLSASAICIAVVASLGGCANLQSIHHTFDYSSSADRSDVRAISVDAQQRFLILSHSTATQGTGTSSAWKACAETSPDAMAAFSSGFGAGASYKDQASAQVASAISEQAASIGLRTQSITLLRDAAYRLCEGFLNGAMTSDEFNMSQRRFQNIMVADLAIEQLTGYARPTIVVLGGTASSGAGNLVLAQKELDNAVKEQTSKDAAAKSADEASAKAAEDYKNKQALGTAAKDALSARAKTAVADAANAKKTADGLEEDAVEKEVIARQAVDNGSLQASVLAKEAATARANAAKAHTAYVSKQAVADALTKDATEKAKAADDAKVAADKAKTTADDAHKAAADAKENVSAATATRDAARAPSTTAGSVAPAILAPPPSGAASAEIARTVKAIVELVVNADYSSDYCMNYFSKGTPAKDDPVFAVCEEKLRTLTEGLKKATTPDQAKEAIKLYKSTM